MNQARDIKTNELIEAESLKHIYEEGVSEYECIDESCRVKLTPCSYKPHNKRRPYFRIASGGDHSDSCRFSAYLKLLEKAKSKRLTEEDLEDMPFPTKLGKKKKVNSGNAIYKTDVSNQKEEKTIKGKRTKPSGEFLEKGRGAKVVSSISPIVDFYLKCPFNRDVELEIEEQQQAYKFWFKRIEKPVLKGNYKGKKLFFGRLHTDKSKIEETDTTMTITMYECERWEKTSARAKTKSQVNPFVISIDKLELSKNKLTRLKNEMEFAIEEKIRAFKSKEEDVKKQAYVFFYGEAPKSKAPYQFKVEDGALVARYCRIYPTQDLKVE